MPDRGVRRWSRNRPAATRAHKQNHSLTVAALYAFLGDSRKTERGAKRFVARLVVRAAPFGLLSDTRKTECGAKRFLARLVLRAAPFALLGRAREPAVFSPRASARECTGSGPGPSRCPPVACGHTPRRCARSSSSGPARRTKSPPAASP